MTERRDAIVIAAIAIVAAVLRLIGIQYGLPAVYNPDEAAIMTRALSLAKGTLNPGNFLYPSLYFYVLFAWVGVYLAFLLATRHVASVAALQRLYFTDPTGIYTAGRVLGVAAGTATVFVLYRLASRVMDRRAAVAAALFLAVAPLHVRDSHYVKHDVPATLAIVVAYIVIVRIWPSMFPARRPLRASALAGAACGVAFSTHYYCVFLALPLAMAIAIRYKRDGLSAIVRHLAVAGLASAAVFFVLSPFILLNPVAAWRDITGNREIVVDRAVASGAFASAFRYVEMLWTDSAGTIVVALSIVGAVWMAVRQPATAALLLAFPVPFLLFIANTAPASRYLNPVIPFIALFAAWAISQVSQRIQAKPLVFWILVLGVATPSLIQSVRVGQFFRQDDTRTLAQQFIEGRIPAGSTVAVQPHSVMLMPTRGVLIEALDRKMGNAAPASARVKLQLSLEPYPSPAYRLIYLGNGLDQDKIYVDYPQLGGREGLQVLRSLGVAFVVVKRYNVPDPATLPFLDALPRSGRRIAAFSPYRSGTGEAEQARIDPFLHNTDIRIDGALERPGPALEIWELNGSGS